MFSMGALSAEVKKKTVNEQHGDHFSTHNRANADTFMFSH